MLESAWLFIGTVAFLWTVVTIALAAYIEPTDNFQIMSADSAVTLCGAIGTVAWGVWTFGTLDVRVVGDAVTYTFTMPAVTILGIAFALVPFFFFLTGPLNLATAGAREPEVERI